MNVNAQWVTTPNGRFHQCRLDDLSAPLRQAIFWLTTQSADREAFVVVECIEVHVTHNSTDSWTVERFVQFCGSEDECSVLFDMPLEQLGPDELARVGPELGNRVESKLVDAETGVEDAEPLITVQKRISDSAEGVRLALLALRDVMRFPPERIVTISMQHGCPEGRN